jgi:hypothetical protein
VEDGLVKITAEDVHAHWPEQMLTAHAESVYCSCGAEFRSSIERTDELWAAHVAKELAARARILAMTEKVFSPGERVTTKTRNMVGTVIEHKAGEAVLLEWDDEAGPQEDEVWPEDLRLDDN